MRATTGALIRAALLTTSALASTAGAADTLQWTGATSGDWTDAANWSPSGPAGAADTALFNTSANPSVTIAAPATSVGAFHFLTTADGYTFDVSTPFSFVGAGVLDYSGSSPVFNIAATLTFANASTAGDATLSNAGTLAFQDQSTAGSAVIVNAGTLTFGGASTLGGGTLINQSGATATFDDTSSAGAGSFVSNDGTLAFNGASAAGTASIFNGFLGTIDFNHTSSAGGATIDNFNIVRFNDTASAGTAQIANGFQVDFYGTSSAGSATITNNGAVTFHDQSTAGQASITNDGVGHTTNFLDRSSAGSATIVNSGAGAATFQDMATAGNATITNSNFGTVIFNDATSAETATINLGVNGRANFFGSSTAGNATIHIGSIGRLAFFDNSTGGLARVDMVAGAQLNIFQTTGPDGDREVSIGSLAGSGGSVAIGTNTLTLGGNGDTTSFSGRLSGTGGSLVKTGGGAFTLAGANLYTGTTTVAGGTLLVDGSIAGSAFVDVGGTLGGTGTVRDTVVSGVLSPGGSIGTLTVNGNLTFNPGGVYLVEASPTSADRTNVSGSASLAGTLRASFLAGSYVFGQSWTVLSAAGGLNGAFSAVETLTPYYLPTLAYTTTDVVMSLAPSFAPYAGGGRNQERVAGVMEQAVLKTSEFDALFGVAPADMPATLSQLSGEIATGAATAAFAGTDQFLDLMLDPFAARVAHTGTAAPLAYADAAPPPAAAQAAIAAAAPASFERRWTAWGAAFGHRGTFAGDTAAGSHRLDAGTAQLAGGVEYRGSADSVVGFALAGGASSYGLSDGLGSGRGETIQAGVYASTRHGPAYVSTALAYAAHEMSTERSVSVAGSSAQLAADFIAHGVGARAEAGYRVAAGGSEVTPFVAAVAQSVSTPAYRETAPSGNAAYALAVEADHARALRSEIGARFERALMVAGHGAVSLRTKIAWAHEFETARSVSAAFAAFPTTGFTVEGASLARDSALVSTGAEWRWRNGIALNLAFDGRFSAQAQSYGGRAALRVAW